MVIRAPYSFLDTPTVADWNATVLNSGLVHLADYSLPSATLLDFEYAFSYPPIQFRSFRVVISKLKSVSTTESSVLIRMLNGASPYSLGNYFSSFRGFTNANPYALRTSASAAGSVWVGCPINDTPNASLVFDISNPQHTQMTSFQGRGGMLGDNIVSVAGQLSVSDVFDGFELFRFGGGNISADVSVYGYRSEL